MYCIKCGKQNSDTANYCYNCAARLYKPGEEPKATQTLEPEKLTETQENSEETKSATEYQIHSPSFTGYKPPDPFENRSPFNSAFRSPLSAFNQADIFNPVLFYSYTNKDKQKVYAAYAGFSLRFAAAFIDTLIMSLPLFIITSLYFSSLTADQQAALVANPNGVTLPSWANLTWYTIYLVYCVLMTTTRGQTFGKMIFGIKIISAKDGSKPDFNTALIRNLFGYSWVLGSILLATNTIFDIVGLFLLVMVMIGFSIAGIDSKRQGWHDKLAGTVVVRKREYVKGVDV